MKSRRNFNVIIVAAGTGKRLGGDVPKQYRMIAGQTILRHTLDVFIGMPEVLTICVVIDSASEPLYQAAIEGLPNGFIRMCYGGKERKDSVYNGLQSLSDLKDDDIVLVHDAARPFVHPSDIYSLIDAMSEECLATTLACPVVDTLRRVDNGENIDRANAWAIQTPQAFRFGTIKKAHEASTPDVEYTDDTALVSALHIPVTFIKGSRTNFKITQQEDLNLAEIMMSKYMETRIGSGFDVHAFDDGAADHVILCGISVPHDRKLKGHSDADVGLHALTDAILGAIGEGDIGTHFPPSNNDFKNMDSAIFLKHAMELLRGKGGSLVNADVTLICERPKIGTYREQMVARMADIMAVSPLRVSIKATTTEQLGFTGRKEGIAAQAVVSVSLPALDA